MNKKLLINTALIAALISPAIYMLGFKWSIYLTSLVFLLAMPFSFVLWMFWLGAKRGE